MRTFLTTLLLGGLFLTSTAQADVPNPEPESQPESEPSTEDTATDSEKSGCSSVGTMDLGVTLLPVIFLGFVAFTRKREE